jgi:hypothetical protein
VVCVLSSLSLSLSLSFAFLTSLSSTTQQTQSHNTVFVRSWCFFFRVRKSFSPAVVLFFPPSSMAALAAASAVMSVAVAAPVASSSTFVSKSGSSGLKVSAFQGRKLGVCNGASRVTMAATEAPSGFTPPQLKADTPSPIFGGNTGGLLRQAQEEEFYVITWDSPKEQIFELPTGMKVSRSSFSSSSFLPCF